ncbi:MULTISPECIES: DNA-processing protein DprA [unclassified Pseudodesulfovibrio]|uniref:DNA-processing protein DprA n=1 Tax=unclassified Pseudodesulfovibrio TaxID=2661612 RepID=UPI000FEBEACF|nr:MULTISPECIES: DNA-processing protein DprA [unclassified Pseudodesulfovibrio]MCJ2163293.1 DNA-processing protein DprA [Pseudodesulfovibrio sp. S3-i]RWU07272.1 DNA-protecting protein DprA [Pseudodesulfovibrio sp. S3]
MDLQKEFFSCLALKHTPRLGPKVWKELFAHYPSAFDAVQDAARWPVLSLAGNAVAVACAGEVWREKAEREYKAVLKQEMDFVTWFDPRFPDALKMIADPPSMLYVRGDITLFKNPGVAVVGARECTRLGLETAGRISAQLSKIGITVVSGLALGIDRQAHLGGLKGIGSSIAVLGCGLDIDYPTGNADVRQELYRKGLVVTEHGPGEEPRGGYFPYRNRIISALALGVLVAEAAHNSGSLITARLAGEQGRDVFAVPGPIGQPTFTGCHRLIKQGAALIESAADIVEILRYDFARELAHVPDPAPARDEKGVDVEKAVVKNNKKTGKPEGASSTASQRRTSRADRDSMALNQDEKRVLDLLDTTDKMHIDALGRQLDLDSSTISRILLMLEMRGAVQQLPGMWYLVRES